jgi:hypothetical protein
LNRFVIQGWETADSNLLPATSMVFPVKVTPENCRKQKSDQHHAQDLRVAAHPFVSESSELFSQISFADYFSQKPIIDSEHGESQHTVSRRRRQNGPESSLTPLL